MQAPGLATVRCDGYHRHTLLLANEVVTSFPTGKLALQAASNLERAVQKVIEQARKTAQ